MVKIKEYEAKKLHDVRELIRWADDQYGERTAYKQIAPDKTIEEFSFRQLNEDMKALGTKLLDLGLQNQHIAVLGENSYQWVLSYVAVINGVGVVVPLDKELPTDDIVKLILKSDVTAIICSKTYVSLVKIIMVICPQVAVCIVMNPDEKNGDQFYSLPELLNQGRQLLSEGNRCYLDIDIDDQCLCEILFTSGTTGANKGVMLSQNNIMAVVYSAMKVIRPGAVSLSVLPINHTYECSCHILGGIYCGLTVCFNDSLKRVIANMRLFKPEFSIMVPIFLETMMKNIWSEVKRNELVGYTQYGIWVSNLLLKFGIDQRKRFFKPILKAFGGNLNQIVCGGAPLRTELIKQFDSIGINVVNGYGISECAPLVACNGSMFKKLGTVGHVIPSCKVRINNPDADGIGEIEVFGDNVMLGYYKDEESTKKTFTEDGWLKTGDLGRLDRKKFLTLVGRDKNLIILPNGKNVHPEELEEIIEEKLEYVKEVMVFALLGKHGEQSKICAACYLDDEWLAEHNVTDAEKYLLQDIRKLNYSLASYKQIADVRISHSEFEKTTTQKIKRHIAERRFNNAGNAS